MIIIGALILVPLLVWGTVWGGSIGGKQYDLTRNRSTYKFYWGVDGIIRCLLTNSMTIFEEFNEIERLTDELVTMTRTPAKELLTVYGHKL